MIFGCVIEFMLYYDILMSIENDLRYITQGTVKLRITAFRFHMN